MKISCQSLLFMIPYWAALTSQAPTFPKPDEVQRIVVWSGQNLDVSNRISEVMREVSHLPSSWQRSWHTPPAPQAEITLTAANQKDACVIWLGPNWLASKCGLLDQCKPMYVHLTSSQGRFFRDVVNGSWEVK